MNDYLDDLETEEYEIYRAGEAYDLHGDDLDDGYLEYTDPEMEAALDDFDEADLSAYDEESDPGLFDDTAELAEALREVLDDRYQNATTEALEDALFDMLEGMAPAEGFSFMKGLRSVGATALPMARTAMGTYFGGPVGASIGGQLGQAAGGAVSGRRKRAYAPPPAPTPAPPLAPTPASAPAPKTASTSTPAAATTGAPTSSAPVLGGPAAATQLLQLCENRDVRKALFALALGSDGQKSIQVGQQGPSVTPGAVVDMLSTVATQAAAEADELLQEGEELSDYLLNSEGEFRYDPAVPEERAMALYKALSEAEEDRLFGEEPPIVQPWSSFFPFAKRAKLLVEYAIEWFPDFNIGNAWVLEHTPNRLKVKIHIDPISRFNVPRTDAVLAIEYKQDGPGNLAAVTVNGQTFADKNVVIRSKGNTREILLSISILGQMVDKIALTKANANKAKIAFMTQGAEHTLVLSPD